MHALLVAEIGEAAYLVDRHIFGDAVAELGADRVGVIGEGERGVPVPPAARQRLRQIPMEERDVGGDPVLVEIVEHAFVMIDPALVRQDHLFMSRQTNEHGEVIGATWHDAKIGRDVEIADAEQVVLSLIGPASAGISAEPPAAEHSHMEAAVGGVACRVVRTHVGVDLICAAEDVQRLREALIAAGAAEVSEAAADIIRVESGRPRFGRDMGPETLPAEAGIAAQQNAHTRPAVADLGDDAGGFLHRAGSGVDVGAAQLRRQQVPAAEDV